MQTTTLGRTGLRVSMMGVGGGGPSQLGRRTGKTSAESVAIIREALDAGVNFIDSAEGYGTEEFIGEAIRGLDRTRLVISTKKSTPAHIKPADVEVSLGKSLRQLGTDYIDLYHLHGVMPDQYDYLHNEILPVLERAREQGKVRFLGVTEMFNQDRGHRMVQRALQDDVWDVMMIGFNILNQSAREQVFSTAIHKDIGILVMFAVRLALSRPEKLQEVIAELIENGQIDPDAVDSDDPLGFLLHEGGATSVVDAAYRFCRDEPGTHVILSGTGNREHLRTNLASFDRPPLPDEDTRRLCQIFARVDSVTGQ